MTTERLLLEAGFIPERYLVLHRGDDLSHDLIIHPTLSVMASRQSGTVTVDDKTFSVKSKRGCFRFDGDLLGNQKPLEPGQRIEILWEDFSLYFCAIIVTRDESAEGTYYYFQSTGPLWGESPLKEIYNFHKDAETLRDFVFLSFEVPKKVLHGDPPVNAEPEPEEGKVEEEAPKWKPGREFI